MHGLLGSIIVAHILAVPFLVHTWVQGPVVILCTNLGWGLKNDYKTNMSAMLGFSVLELPHLIVQGMFVVCIYANWPKSICAPCKCGYNTMVCILT